MLLHEGKTINFTFHKEHFSVDNKKRQIGIVHVLAALEAMPRVYRLFQRIQKTCTR